MADIPHLALPLRLDGGSFAVVEQDTLADIIQCARVVLTTPEGFREELPEFGLRDPVFGLGGVDHGLVDAALAEWEPRADMDARRDDSRLQDGISHLILDITKAD